VLDYDSLRQFFMGVATENDVDACDFFSYLDVITQAKLGCQKRKPRLNKGF
jgi:hypothetical protein